MIIWFFFDLLKANMKWTNAAKSANGEQVSEQTFWEAVVPDCFCDQL